MWAKRRAARIKVALYGPGPKPSNDEILQSKMQGLVDAFKQAGATVQEASKAFAAFSDSVVKAQRQAEQLAAFSAAYSGVDMADAIDFSAFEERVNAILAQRIDNNNAAIARMLTGDFIDTEGYRRQARASDYISYSVTGRMSGRDPAFSNRLRDRLPTEESIAELARNIRRQYLEMYPAIPADMLRGRPPGGADTPVPWQHIPRDRLHLTQAELDALQQASVNIRNQRVQEPSIAGIPVIVVDTMPPGVAAMVAAGRSGLSMQSIAAVIQAEPDPYVAPSRVRDYELGARYMEQDPTEPEQFRRPRSRYSNDAANIRSFRRGR